MKVQSKWVDHSGTVYWWPDTSLVTTVGGLTQARSCPQNVFTFGEFSTVLLFQLTFTWFIPVTLHLGVLLCNALHVSFHIHHLPSFIFTTHLGHLIISIFCVLCLAWSLSELAYGRVFCTMEPLFLHGVSAFPSAAGRMLRATGQTAHTICLRDGNRSSARKHVLSLYAFYNICASKVSHWLYYFRGWVSRAKWDSAAAWRACTSCVYQPGSNCNNDFPSEIEVCLKLTNES